ncbi:MAG: type II secretion system F family protein [Deltaproteobacteria bacterium]|nr:MAG: type II secretion system F family protein [Deltaproteobacteria bacterium]
MNYFRYKVMEPTGKVSSGIVKLPYKDVLSAISYLEREDNTAIYVKKLSPIASFFFRLFTLRVRKRVTRTFQAEFLRNVSLMLSAGMTLTTALEEAAASSDKPGFETDIKDMIVNIQGGASFSAAAEKYPYIFPKTVSYLIRLGEETGKLERMLMDASEHLRRIDHIVSDTKQALLYPVFVLVSMGAGLLFWLYYVVPKIIGLFKEMDVSLPRITDFVLKVSAFVQANFLNMILGITVAIVSIVLGYKGNQKFRKRIDAILLKLPVCGTIIAASTMAFITEYFSLLLNVGIDILQSLQLLKDTIKNEVYRDKLGVVRSGLTRGEGIAEAFREAVVFPPFVVRMIHVGEQSGTLPEQLSRIAEDYRNRLSLIVATIGKSIEPVVLVVAGTMFAIIIIALFLPIYDLVTKVSGR